MTKHHVAAKASAKAKHGSKPSGKGKGKIKHILVRPAHNGGMIAEHQYEPDDESNPFGGSSETHVFPNAKKTGAHMNDMLAMMQAQNSGAEPGEGSPEEEAQDQTEAA